MYTLPSIYLLFLLLSKEFFSYDSEKVVIGCILTFIIIFYYNFNEIIHATLSAKANQLEVEYRALLSAKKKVEIELKNVWESVFIYEKNLTKFFFYYKHVVITFIQKYNKNRFSIIKNMLKDSLTLVVKNQIKLNQSLVLYLLQNSISYLTINTETKPLNDPDSLFKNFSEKFEYSNLIYLIINKLNLNQEIFNDNWFAYNSYLSFVLSTEYDKD